MSEIVPTETERQKLEAFLPRDSERVAGYELHPFTAGRKLLLQLTGNELLNATKHIDAYLARQNLSLSDDEKSRRFGELLTEAVPEAGFHLAALAYICVADVKELAAASKRAESFREKVLAFADSLTDSDFRKITDGAIRLLADSAVGQDFEVEKTDDDPN